MLHHINKILIMVAVSLGMISVPSIQAASTTKSIRYAAALLRGPAAYLEYKLRNDTSLRAHALRMAIHSVRMLDDSLVPPPPEKDAYSLSAVINGMSTWHHLISWFIYDIAAFIKGGKACVMVKNAPSAIIKDDQEHEFLRSVILPTAEMICALVRIASTTSNGSDFANIVMSIVRLCELYYAAPHNSAKRTAIKCLLCTCIIELLVKSNRLHKIKQRVQQPPLRLKHLLDENQNILWTTVW